MILIAGDSWGEGQWLDGPGIKWPGFHHYWIHNQIDNAVNVSYGGYSNHQSVSALDMNLAHRNRPPRTTLIWLTCALRDYPRAINVKDIDQWTRAHYEGVFDRVPLSMVGERWLVENTGTSAVGRLVYDVVKRSIDIIFAVVLGAVSLLFYPFVYVAIRMDDKGPLFIKQERIGKNGKPVRIIKFRSMASASQSVDSIGKNAHNDAGSYNNGKSALKVTRVGKFIRMTRIDELPQLWNVLRGDISLV
jgi:hypothetical protein